VELAEILGTRLGIRLQIHECLLEVSVRDPEGKNERNPVLLRNFSSMVEDGLIHKKNTRFPEGKSWSEVEKRSGARLGDVLTESRV
jgi:hypothetical protein